MQDCQHRRLRKIGQTVNLVPQKARVGSIPSAGNIKQADRGCGRLLPPGVVLTMPSISNQEMR